MRDVTINAQDVMSRITLHVRLQGMQMLRWRVRVGCGLLRLVAHVMGCNLSINTEADHGRTTA